MTSLPSVQWGSVAPPTTILPASTFNVYPAVSYANNGVACVWDGAATNDVGPCVNAAIAAAAAGGGGTVVIPAGTYYLATQIRNSTSGVRIIGAGLGSPRDTTDPSHYLAYTRLIWNGAAAATMCDIEPVAEASAQSLFDAGVSDILFDCAALANIGFKAAQVSWSKFRVAAAEPRSIGILITTIVTTDAPGTQHNDFWLHSRATATSDSYHPTGIVIDGGAGSSWNVSGNRFYDLSAWFNSGDGIVFGNSDNNVIIDISTYPEPAVSNGTPVVFANSLYVPPNGVAVHGQSYNNYVLHGLAPITVKGSAGGATPATSIIIDFVDKANSVADPTFATGSTGAFSTSTAPYRIEGIQPTFTPGIGFGLPALSVGVTYGTRSGKVTKIGRWVFVEGSITLTNKGSSVGQATITGLPYTSDLVLTGGVFIPYYSGMLSITSFNPYIASNVTTIVLNKPDTTSVTAYTDANFTNATRIDFVAVYLAQ